MPPSRASQCGGATGGFIVNIRENSENIMAYDTIEDALNLGVIELEPRETNDRIGFRQDGKRERDDYYKFTIREESEFNLTLDNLEANADVQILDSDGSVLFRSNNPGRRAETINENLEPGDYFVRVLAVGRAQTDYRLSLSAAPKPIEEDDKAPGRSLGVLDSMSEPVVINDKIGFGRGDARDVNDFFNFSLNKDSDVSINLDQLRQNANIEILDADGETVLFQSMNPGRQEDSINGIFKAGDYVVRVFPHVAARTEYRLELKADEVLPPEELPGTQLGDLIGKEEPFVIVQDIGFGIGSKRNQRDFYTFQMSQDASFYAQMDELKAGANLLLHEYDPSRPKQLGSLLERVRAPGNRPRTISNFLEVGDYALVVGAQGRDRTDYRLELEAQINQSDYPTLGAAKDLGELGVRPINEKNNVGLLIGDRFRDQEDWFKFSISAEKNVDLVVDELRVNVANVEIYNSDGELIHKSEKDGRNARKINDIFDPGDYYVRVFATGSGNTDYRLSLSAEEPISPVDIIDINALGKSYSNFDNVGQAGSGVRNELDVYNFTLNDSSDINVTLDQFNQNINLELYQGFFDPDSRRGRPIAVSEERGRTPENIAEVLESGNYHLRVVPVGNAETRYRLAINSEVVDVGVETTEVGSLDDRRNGEFKISDSIGFTDGGVRNSRDEYNFSLGVDSRLTLTLDELRMNANVAVFDSDGKMVMSGFNPGRADEFLNGELEAGDYQVQVFPVGAARTNYFLKMNAVPTEPKPPERPIVDPITGEDPDGTLETATDLGILDSNFKTPRDRIGFTEDGVRDLNDYYRFTLNEPQSLTILLDGMRQNADLELLNSDGRMINSSNQGGNNTDIIAQNLDAGDYYLRVYPVGLAQTPYDVEFMF
ncbi:PPC domain-containing protein [Limnospira platensis CENA597]|uniref:PPC domain-containing protein n=1 Tax=Limnospira platensis TaxID=118562 RepID=UPI003D9FF27C